MTGFGKCTKANEEIEVSVEIRTLNGKSLRVRYSLPRAFNPFLNEINNIIRDYIKRGEVDLHIRYRLSPNITVPVTINYKEALKYIEASDRIGALSGRKIEVSLRDLLSIPDLFMKEEIDLTSHSEILFEALKGALEEVEEARKKEGEKLKVYCEERLKVIEEILKELQSQIKDIEKKLFERLKEKVEKLLSTKEFSEDFQRRIELEVALLAEKQDVSEEISRLHTHIARFRELLEFNEPVGKTLDFLCQEIHREINTLGNKIKEVDITEPVLKIKTEVAKLKEQVQNIE
ncbi:YicC/YloC family endoribonuclease [Desulfurobacterium thermolithotrophum]|uniref:YicC/YloC family endoribonuclease n=1 Tax=Desulfurobacterium thermolithotrophum TaxID=64160 RepID=UPI001EF7DF70|nr:YicC/YloC family endoribonuclease [Desulfurobacterium thermolithotrophum]